MEHAQTCQSPPDVVAVMTQQPASPPDVISIALMTKSSSKVLGRFPTINSITGRSCYRKANSKIVRLYALDKSSPDLTGAQVTRLYIIKEQAFGGGAYSCHGHFWGRSLFMSRTFMGGAYSCHGHLGEELFHVKTCPNMPKPITTRCL